MDKEFIKRTWYPSKISHKDPNSILDSQFKSLIEDLQTGLSALYEGFDLDSPLYPILQTLELICSELAGVIASGAIKLTSDTMEISPIWGTKYHKNFLSGDPERVPDPLVDQRDDVKIYAPEIGQWVTILSSNPKYKRKRIKGKDLINPEKLEEFFWFMASTVGRIMSGADIGFQYDRESQTPHRNPPEGKRLSKSEYYYWKRWRLRSKGQK